MGTVQIKDELHRYIEAADSRLLKLLYDVAKDYNHEGSDFQLSALSFHL